MAKALLPFENLNSTVSLLCYETFRMSFPKDFPPHYTPSCPTPARCTEQGGDFTNGNGTGEWYMTLMACPP